MAHSPLLDGLPSTVSGTQPYTELIHEPPDEELMMPVKTCGSMPCEIAKFIASAQPAMLIAMAMLLQIFATWPEPDGPQCTIFSPITSKYGLAAANAAASPPTMKVKVPRTAFFTPPYERMQMRTGDELSRGQHADKLRGRW